MRLFLFCFSILATFITCQNSTQRMDANIPDTVLIVKETSLSDSKLLSLAINGDTIDYPFEFSERFIKTKYLPSSTKKLNDYLIQLNEIIPYYLAEVNDSSKFNLLINNGLSHSYPYKFDRKKLFDFLKEKNIQNTSTNSVLNTSLMYSNFKTDIENILPNGYIVKSFESEKIAFNLKDLKKQSTESSLDSIGFAETPFIGMLWIKIEKQN